MTNYNNNLPRKLLFDIAIKKSVCTILLIKDNTKKDGTTLLHI